jgi:hypothetical protein
MTCMDRLFMASSEGRVWSLTFYLRGSLSTKTGCEIMDELPLKLNLL